jgi:hypothetical protein
MKEMNFLFLGLLLNHIPVRHFNILLIAVLPEIAPIFLAAA